jgi:hypothetical protein
MERCSFCGFPLAPHKEKYCTMLCEVLSDIEERGDILHEIVEREEEPAPG